MDLIDRAALIASMGLENAVKWGNKDGYQQAHSYSTMMLYEIKYDIDAQPTIEAAPLDALCEWLAGWDIQVIPCNVCKNVFQLESCPHGPFDCGDSEHFRMLIKKWMEGQHDNG